MCTISLPVFNLNFGSDMAKKLYRLNTDMVELKIINLQIDNLSKFLSKFSVFFYKKSFLTKEVSREEIKRDVEEKFLLYLTKFLDFQISYFSRMKTLIDIESIFILLLCALNTTSQIKKNLYEEPLSSEVIFAKLQSLNNSSSYNLVISSSFCVLKYTNVSEFCFI